MTEPDATELLARTFEEHHDFVWRTLRLMGVAVMDLDDATQEVFLVLSRRIDDFDADASMRGWLYGITRNVAAKHRERQAIVARRSGDAPPSVSSSQPTPEQSLERAEALARIQAFLDGLPEDQREVFLLADVEELTAPEVADCLGVPVNTVYSRLRLARVRFERFLQREHARDSRLSNHG